MKSKVLTLTIAAVLTVGIGVAAAYAADAGSDTYREMHPYMLEMHHNMNEAELQEMYESCHQDEGYSNMQQMMNYHSSMQ